MKKLLIILIAVFLYCEQPQSTPITPKKGETWIYVWNDNNPFAESDTIIYKILDTKDKYVLYKNLTHNVVESSTIKYFMIDAHKLNTEEL